MLRLRRFTFILFFLMLFNFFASGADKPEFKIPDFAYPRQVIADAEKILDATDRLPDSGADRLCAILQIITAQRNIDTDTIFSQPAFIEAQLAHKGIDPATKAMLLALEAEVFKTIYESKRYVYDRVDAPLEPYPADISTWSGEQFRTKILALLDSAQSFAGDTPLSRYSASVDYSPDVLQYFPDVLAFVWLKKEEALTSFSRSGNNYLSEKRNLIDKAITSYGEASAPFFFWSVKRAQMQEASRSELLSLYKKYSHTEAARYILSKIDAFSRPDIREEMISLISTSLADFPDWYGNNELTNTLYTLRQPTVILSAPSVVAPGKPFKFTAAWRFAKAIRIGAYKIPTGISTQSKKIVKKYSEETAWTYSPDSIIGSAEASFTLGEPGRYALVITVDGVCEDYSPTIEVSPLFPFAVNGCSQIVAAAVDFTTGAPLPDVSFSKISNRRNSKNIPVGKTGKNGTLVFDAPKGDRWESERLTASYKGLNYDFLTTLWVQGVGREDPVETQHSMLIFTDRPIYHPGDTIEWAAVAAHRRSDGSDPKVESGATFYATLLDVNGEEVDSLTLDSDELGRICGKFAIPKGHLTGYYTIDIDGDDINASQDVMVSDYKAPVFEAEITSVRRDDPCGGCVTLEGLAKTYSGMPVADADIVLRLYGLPRSWYYMRKTDLGQLYGSTDADGKFTFTIPAELLATKLDGNSFSFFEADITVTSKTAETASVSRRFATGRPYALSVDVAHAVNSDKVLTFRPEALNSDGQSTPIALTWEIIAESDSSVVLSGSAEAGKSLSVDISGLPSADYKIVLKAADKALADEFTSSIMALYSIKNGTIASSLPILFTPQKRVKLSGHKVIVTVGTTSDEQYIFAFVRSGRTLAPVKTFTIKRGFSTLPIELPNGFKPGDGQILLATVRDGKMYESEISVEMPEAEPTTIVAESFRDRLVLGSSETWRFRLAKGADALADAGVIATLYDKALDALISSQWPADFHFYRQAYNMDINSLRSYPLNYTGSLPTDYLDTLPVTWPKFRYYGDYFGTNGGVMYRSVKMKANLTAAAKEDDFVEEAVVEDADYAAAPMEAAAGVMTEVEAEAGAEPEVEYREGEVALAFWRPSLVSDAEGNVDIVFTVPNANTTWQLRSFGWTKTLDTATFAAEALASKPVMVQPNVPRFLRQGDRAQVAATTFNNSDDTLSVATVAEIFDMATGAVISTERQENTLAPKASAVTTIEVVAPTDASAIGYRVRAIARGFADGEQAAIPILTSAATVIESTQFYLNPADSEPFEFTVDASTDATLTLSYCQNPVWTIVKAMRGIAAGESITSPATVSRLFSALTARHLVSTNADIAEALRLWKENPSEDALVSMLAKNETLKKLMLDQTPWVQASKSQTQRMEMLASLLDPEASKKAVADLSEALQKLQQPDGGYAWGSWSNESSVWCTENVLITLGIARSLGMLDDSFDTPLSAAFSYLQKELASIKGIKTDTELALIASFFPGFKQTVAGSGIIRNTVAGIARNWKKDNTVDKAYDVLILNANGRKAEAQAVLASIRQFAVAKPGQGLCFPNVSDIRGYATVIQAYATMGASAAELDALRQWVIVQAQALDDLGAWNPDYVIAAVLLTGSDWTSVPVENAVTINGKPFDAGRVESMTGYFSTTLPPEGNLLHITVKPNGITPSYGSVVSVAKAPARSVKARPGRDLSIDKRCLVERDGKWVETTGFTLGERVRIQLIIKASRDLEYVSVDDERPASFEPVDQLPGFVYNGGLAFYRENNDASTSLFVSWMPKGTYMITYDMTAASAGSFVSGIATVQSQYAPELTAHSAGSTILVGE